MPSSSLIRFGAFELDLDSGEVRKRGRKVKLPPQPFRLFALLASRPGQLVTRETIRKTLWGEDTFVDFEHGLNFCIRQIRNTLGESAKRPRFIETLPRRGYRFVAQPPSGQRAQNVTGAGLGAVASRSAGARLAMAENCRGAIAVLEFQNLCGDDSIEWLATGIAESLTADLRNLHSVQVVSLDRVHAILRQTDKADPACVHVDYVVLGQQMGADWIVTGSYQFAGGRLRITPQLFHARTGEVVSTRKVDGTWDEIFELQDRVASELIETLKLTADSDEIQRMTTPETLYLEAYEEYSKGRRKFHQLGKRTLDEARQHFERALALDPQYAMAHSGLGATYAMRFIYRTNPDDLAHARTHLECARELDPELAEPYPWLCYVYIRDGKLREALDAGKRGAQLLPDLVHAHYFLGLAYFVSCEIDPSSYQNAANHLLQASRIEPRWQATWLVLVFLSLLNGNYERAEAFAQRLLQLSAEEAGMPHFVGAEVMLGTIWLRRESFEAARGWFTRSLEMLSKSDHMYRDGLRALSACGLGDIHLREGKPSLALADFRRAWQIVQEYPTMLARDRHSVRALAGLAAAYAAQGEYERAKGLLSQAVQILEKSGKLQSSSAAGASSADVYYAVAVAYVRMENTNEALEMLERALSSGWRDVGWLEHDSELRRLHQEPRFRDLLHQIRQSPTIELEP